MIPFLLAAEVTTMYPVASKTPRTSYGCFSTRYLELKKKKICDSRYKGVGSKSFRFLLKFQFKKNTVKGFFSSNLPPNIMIELSYNCRNTQ